MTAFIDSTETQLIPFARLVIYINSLHVWRCPLRRMELHIPD